MPKVSYILWLNRGLRYVQLALMGKDGQKFTMTHNTPARVLRANVFAPRALAAYKGNAAICQFISASRKGRT